MLLGFYKNVTPDDLICKVLPSGEDVPSGQGASLQLNANECVRDASPHLEIWHPGRVTLGASLSREDLVAGIEAHAKGAYDELGGEARGPHQRLGQDAGDAVVCVAVVHLQGKVGVGKLDTHAHRQCVAPTNGALGGIWSTARTSRRALKLPDQALMFLRTTMRRMPCICTTRIQRRSRLLRDVKGICCTRCRSEVKTSWFALADFAISCTEMAFSGCDGRTEDGIHR